MPNREIQQTETEWIYSQLEFIASNRANRLLRETTMEYERVIKDYGFSSREAIDFLKEKYEIPT